MTSRIPSIVDDITVRLIAAIILVLSTLALLTSAWWLYALLAVDFTLRAVLGPRPSPLARLVGAVRPRIGVAPRPTAFAPKRFAAGIGAVMTLAAATLLLLQPALGAAAGTVALVIGVAMVLFPLLEAAFGFCVGCRIFAGLIRLGVVSEDVCVDCAPSGARTRPTSTAKA